MKTSQRPLRRVGFAFASLGLCAVLAACAGGGGAATPGARRGSSSEASAGAPRRLVSAGPALAVDAAIARHPISPDIYGVTIFWSATTSSALRQFAKDVRLPANRYGGDGTTRYNWNFDSSNAGSDWYFVAGNGQTSVTPGASVDTIVDGNRTNGTKSIITIPIIDYINNSSPWHCSYPESQYPNQVGINGNPPYDPYLTVNGGDHCGSGSNASGYITDTNVAATDIPNQPGIQQAWVTHFVSKYGKASSGGVPIYELDNEPNGWIAVHHDVRPQNVGYHELVSKSVAYASAVKAADPSALVLGPDDIPPADENCNGGQPSGVSGTCNGDDASANGGTPLGLWYLQQFATHSPRLLDYYAMHYPGACCFSTNGTLDDMVVAIHRHQSWIASAYPGTKLAYDEWNRGTGNGFANGLATADGLGVFGRENVDLASFWGLDDPSYPSAFAFRIFRDYDGNGSTFGNVSISATSADTSQLTIYAALRRVVNPALTVLVVNSSATDLSSTVTIANFSITQPLQVWSYTSANAAAIVAGTPLAAAGGAVTTVFPAQSLTLLVIPSAPLGAHPQRQF